MAAFVVRRRVPILILGLLVLVPLGMYFLVRAVRDPIRVFVRGRKRLQYDPPEHLLADVAGWFEVVTSSTSGRFVPNSFWT